MYYNLNGIINVTKDRCVVFSDYVTANNRDYSLTLYLIGCNGSWNQPETKGDICTIEFKSKKFVKVGEWAGLGQFIEMNIYQSGLYATSRFDIITTVGTNKEDLIHLKYKNFENSIIPKNTQIYRFLKIIDRLLEKAKFQ